MLKAFFKLVALVVLPIVLLIYVETYNPVTMVRLYLTKQYYVTTYMGTFYLISERLSHLPQAHWPQEFDKVADQFGYKIQLLPFKSASEISGQEQPLNQGGFVLVDEDPPLLMQKVNNSRWVVSMTMGIEDAEDNRRSADGSVYLIRQYFESRPEAQWPRVLRYLQTKFGLNLQLLNRDNISFPPEKLDDLEAINFTWIETADGETFYLPLNSGDQILAAGPVSISGINTTMIASVIVILSVSISIGLLCWLRPLWRDIKALDKRAFDFGNGDLNSRVKISKSSIAARLGSSFNRMADNVQQLISTNRQLTNSVAHDLRTPLARLRFAFEILDSEHCSEEEKQRYRSSIRSSIDSLDYLINQTLIHSRYTRIPDASQFSYCKLVSSLNNEVEEYALNHESINFIFKADQQLTSTRQWVDLRALNRVLSNLLSNASRFAESTIRVSLTIEENFLNLIVEDDGPGLPREDREKVFLPFAQIGNEQRDAASGHGLGLAIVGQIAKWHQGSIDVSQATLGGARFRFRWPARLSDD